MDGGRAPFSHTFGAAVAVWRWSLNMAVFYFWHVYGGDGRVVTESTGQHVADGIVNAVLQQGCANSVRGRAVYLSFHDGWIDHRAAVVYRNVIENCRDKSFTVHFHDRDVQLRCIRQRQVAILPLLVRNFEWRTPDVAAVERDVIHFNRKDGTVDIDNVGQPPIVDRLPC